MIHIHIKIFPQPPKKQPRVPAVWQLSQDGETFFQGTYTECQNILSLRSK